MCIVPTVTFDLLFAFLVLGHGRRQLLWCELTRHPTAEWLARQITEAFPWASAPAYLVRDNDRVYVRHECLDRILIFGESQLRRVLASYAAYYNQTRTDLALQKDAPLRRAVQRYGQIVTIPILSGPIINMCGCDFRKGQVPHACVIRTPHSKFCYTNFGFLETDVAAQR